MEIYLTYDDYELVKFMSNAKMKYEIIVAIVKNNSCVSEGNIIIKFHSELDIYKLRNDIIKFIHFNKIEYSNSKYLNLLKNIDSQYAILDILVLSKEQYNFLVKLGITHFNLREVYNKVFFQFESNIIESKIIEIEDKVADHLMMYGFDLKYEPNSIGIICEQILDILYDQLI